MHDKFDELAKGLIDEAGVVVRDAVVGAEAMLDLRADMDNHAQRKRADDTLKRPGRTDEKERETIGIPPPEGKVATFAPTAIDGLQDLSALLKSGGSALKLRGVARGFTSAVTSDAKQPGLVPRFVP